MRVLFTSLRNIGHFQPLVPLIEACRRSGHDVQVATPRDLAARVQSTGATFVPVGHPGDDGLRPLWQRLRELPASEQNAFAVARIFADACAGAALPALLQHTLREPPDIIVREAHEYSGLLVGEKLRVPSVRVAISLENLLEECLPSLLPVLDGHRAALGLGPEGAAARLGAEPIVTQFPPALLPDAPGAQPLRFRAQDALPPGPLPLPVPASWEGEELPLVYLTLGTITGSVSELRAAYRLVLDAVATLPVRALLTTGEALEPSLLGAVPARVHVERFVPQARLLPHVRAVVCHGGSGTVLGALAAGVPLVVLPLFADQPANAREVAHCGAGLTVPFAGATPEAIAAALTRVLAEPAFAARARAIAASMAALPHAQATPAWFERLAQGAPAPRPPGPSR